MDVKNITVAGAVALAAFAAGTVPALAATATETITTGGIVMTAPDMTFAAVAVTGVATSQSGSYALDVDDLSGHNAGWHVTLAGAALTNADTTTLATTATPAGFAACTIVVIGCATTTTAAATAPFVISPTAVPLFSAAVNTGELDHNFATSMSVAIPAAVSSGAYTSVWTVSVTSGP